VVSSAVNVYTEDEWKAIRAKFYGDKLHTHRDTPTDIEAPSDSSRATTGAIESACLAFLPSVSEKLI